MRNCMWTTVAGVVAVWLMSAPAYAQAQGAPTTAAASGAARTWTPPRTPDGQPDIQGIWEGGASFQDQGGVQVEVNVGPRDCNTYGKSAVNTECAAYPALWTTAQRSGEIGKQSQGLRRGLIDPADGKLPWNAEGRAKYQDIVKHIYDPPALSYLDPHARCMLPGVPRGGPGGIQILQIPGHVVLFLEYDHVSRVIPIDGRPHVGPNVRLFMGDSVGRWEGNTLVVDTTNFTGRTWYDMVGTIQSDALHTVERFTPIDANTIEYVVTVDDPKLFSRPWTFAGGFTKAVQEGMQTTELYEYACAEGLKAVDQSLERPGKTLPPVKYLPRE